MPLDTPTLFVVSLCITGLLGLLLLVLWMQDQSMRALGWWAAAYLIGGSAVAWWVMEPFVAWPLARDVGTALMFLACGMIWSGARMFHGRSALFVATVAGAIIWLMGAQLRVVAETGALRIALSCIVTSAYVLLTAIELKRERRQSERARMPALTIPVLHGLIFLSPVLIIEVLPNGLHDLNRQWFALFALLALIYVVAAAFVVVVMVKERNASIFRTAAFTDPLTGSLNRRGFFEEAVRIIREQAKKGEAVAVLMFDLDHFKSINDRFGHATGDEALRVFAGVLTTNMRADDVTARLGGEEFAAIIPGGVEAARGVAERVRQAFVAAGDYIDGHRMAATVSIGVATAPARLCDLSELMARADRALYRAKTSGRNRVVAEAEETTRSTGDLVVPSLVLADLPPMAADL
jgi:diguanylate cyclase (GGDEF)-like protein